MSGTSQPRLPSVFYIMEQFLLVFSELEGIATGAMFYTQTQIPENLRDTLQETLGRADLWAAQ